MLADKALERLNNIGKPTQGLTKKTKLRRTRSKRRRKFFKTPGSNAYTLGEIDGARMIYDGKLHDRRICVTEPKCRRLFIEGRIRMIAAYV